MNFVKLELSQYHSYSYVDASTVEMYVLGLFFTATGCHTSIYKEWALADKSAPYSKFSYTCGANIILLEEDNNGDIHLVDDTGSDPDDIYYIPGRIKMTREQFVQLLDDWQETVCKHRPKEIVIKYINDQFTIETYD